MAQAREAPLLFLGQTSADEYHIFRSQIAGFKIWEQDDRWAYLYVVGYTGGALKVRTDVLPKYFKLDKASKLLATARIKQDPRNQI